MLPRIFANNFRDPMGTVRSSNNRWRSPLLSSLSFNGSLVEDIGDVACDIEVNSGSPVGEDVIYVLPQLPSALHIRRISYKVEVPYIVPEMREVYYKGVFSNSITMNLHNFDKFDFMYLPFRLGEFFNNAEFEIYGFSGQRQANLRHPAQIYGELLLLPQKYPNEKQVSKQKNMCFRSCIFK